MNECRGQVYLIPVLACQLEVKRLLQDSVAKGKRRANYSKTTAKGKHWEWKPEMEWIWTDA